MDSETSGGATFYSDGVYDMWFLEDTKTHREYPLKAVTHIRKEGSIVKENLSPSEAQWHEDLSHKKITTYSCLVHFEKLPSEVNTVNLIEGHGKSTDKRRFNFFNIKIQTQ